MSKRDYYDVLGLKKGAATTEVKASFRKLAMELHPDKNPGDHTAEIKFKEINEAYDVLKDEQKRAAYDRFGEFGGRGKQGRRQNRGGDLRYNLEITLEEAFTGRATQIRVPSAVACEACSGTGAEAGSKPEQCPTCSGIGKVRAQQGFFTIERTCPQCRGNGRIVRNPCKQCKGSGLVQKERTLSVDVPSGVEEGTRIRLSGEGQAGMNGGPPGDLYIFISVAPHAIFQRDGHDLHCRAPVSFVTAALGGAIEVPTLDGGRAKINIPEATQSGRPFRLRAKGMPVLRGGGMTGDLYVEVVVETPAKLSKKQKELLKAFDAESGAGTNPESESFMAKLKEFWKGGEKA